jgi:hypothetical protein
MLVDEWRFVKDLSLYLSLKNPLLGTENAVLCSGISWYIALATAFHAREPLIFP